MEDPDQTAFSEAVWIGSAWFAEVFFGRQEVFKYFEHLRCFLFITLKYISKSHKVLFTIISVKPGVSVQRVEQTWKTLIKLLLQKQSDLGLHDFPRSFWQDILNIYDAFYNLNIYLLKS